MDAKDLETIEGKVCSKCGEWKPLEEFNKHKLCKDGRRPECRECQKRYTKQWRKDNKEHRKEYSKQWKENNPEYYKQHYQNNKECYKEQNKQWREDNKEYRKKYTKQYYQNNKEHIKECYQNNKEYKREYDKQYYQNNKEYCKEYSKQKYENNKQNNLQYIFSIVEQINPIFKQLNLPIYGYVYMLENVKTGHKYVGQSINPIKRRYAFEGGIVKSWIKERLEKSNQKFKDELIEEDFVVTETLDVAFCQYHLDKLEAYYIDKYNSLLNGYNNNAGNHDTDDGIDEFNQILVENNLEFKDGKLIQIKAPTQK